jgi:hypothetical protein
MKTISRITSCIFLALAMACGIIGCALVGIGMFILERIDLGLGE